MMRVIALRRGEKAPMGADRISIARTNTGEFKVSGALAVDKRTVATNAPAEHFTTESNALNAAIAWANNGGCMMLYVERSGQPGPPTAVALPL